MTYTTDAPALAPHIEHSLRYALTQWMTIAQAAAYLHLSRQRISQLLRQTPPVFERAQIGELIVLSRASVQDYAARRFRGET